jgi:hypothetical protein
MGGGRSPISHSTTLVSSFSQRTYYDAEIIFSHRLWIASGTLGRKWVDPLWCVRSNDQGPYCDQMSECERIRNVHDVDFYAMRSFAPMVSDCTHTATRFVTNSNGRRCTCRETRRLGIVRFFSMSCLRTHDGVYQMCQDIIIFSHDASSIVPTIHPVTSQPLLNPQDNNKIIIANHDAPTCPTIGHGIFSQQSSAA